MRFVRGGGTHPAFPGGNHLGAPLQDGDPQQSDPTDTTATTDTIGTAAVACRIRDLTVAYRLDQGEFAAIRDFNLDIHAGNITAVIGESGSGKSTLALAMMNAVSQPGRIVRGSVRYDGIGDVVQVQGDQLRRLRGPHVGMVFQASQSSLNPLKRIGAQILDLGRSHGYKDPRILLREAKTLALRMSLNPERVLSAYQHQLSGGMRQRVGIIFALVLHPKILLLDEPTTALDVLSQSAVLDIVRDIQRERQLTVVLITHDMGVVAELAERVVVMYAGRLVEQGAALEVLRESKHPYTRALIQAIPRLTGDVALAKPLPGLPPNLASIPTTGCVFRDRCPYRMDICDTDDPVLQSWGGDRDHRFACHLGGVFDD